MADDSGKPRPLCSAGKKGNRYVVDVIHDSVAAGLGFARGRQVSQEPLRGKD